MGRRIITDGSLALPLHPKCWGGDAPPRCPRGDSRAMFSWLARFLVFRVLGGRALIALAVVNFLRRRLGGRGNGPGRGVYQPSQGESQTAQRDPR